MSTRNRFRRLLEFTGLIKKSVSVTIIAEHPQETEPAVGVLHIVGGKDYAKWAYLRCPCSCGARIMLSLSRNSRPSWSVTVDWLGRPTIFPSVRQLDGCYSHFWLKRGVVELCHDTGQRWPGDDRDRDEYA